MANRRDYYFRQKVTEAELDAGFEGLEEADRNIAVDSSYVGAMSGLAVSQHAGTPNISVDVAAGAAYDQGGQRMALVTTQNVNVALDFNGVSTAVVTPGNEKWVGIYLQFDRALSDPRIDGNSLTVQFVRDESFKFKVIQGAEAGAGLAVPPALQVDAILLADAKRLNPQTQVLNANISATRRQDLYNIAGTPLAVRAGSTNAALTAIQAAYNAHVTGAADKHPAADLTYAGGGSWAGGTSPTNPAATIEAQFDKIIADLSATTAGAGGTHRIGGAAVPGTPAISAGTLISQLTALKAAVNLEYAGGGSWAAGSSPTNPAATIEAQLDKIIADLSATASGASGAHRIGVDARTAWLGGRTNPATDLFSAIEKVGVDLSATAASDDGAERIGAEAVSGFSAGSVRSQLNELGPSVTGTTFTAAKTFNGAAGDTNAALITTAAVSSHKLLWEIGNGTEKLRFYAAGATFEITQNARWNGTGYERDTAGASSRFTFKNDTGNSLASLKLEYHDAGSATPWTVWDGTGTIFTDSGTAWQLGSTGVQSVTGSAASGIVGIQCDTSGASQSFGAAATFRAKFLSTPSSVSYSTIGIADVNLGTAFAVGTTTFNTLGIFVTGASTASGTARCARSFSVS